MNTTLKQRRGEERREGVDESKKQKSKDFEVEKSSNAFLCAIGHHHHHHGKGCCFRLILLFALVAVVGLWCRDGPESVWYTHVWCNFKTFFKGWVRASLVHPFYWNTYIATTVACHSVSDPLQWQ
jgi:hypothetical protein